MGCKKIPYELNLLKECIRFKGDFWEYIINITSLIAYYQLAGVVISFEQWQREQEW